jgi:hypothetical protein
MNYDLAVLDNAFLVHAPGIKRVTLDEEKKRAPFIVINDMVREKIRSNLKEKYGTKNHC